VKLALKVLGIVVGVIAAIAVGLVMLGIGEVDTASVDSQKSESAQDLAPNQKNENAQSDSITFLVDPIPQNVLFSDLIRKGIDIAFNEWNRKNPDLVFEETTDKDADMHIIWYEVVLGEHRGAGKPDCIGLGDQCEIIIGLGELNCANEFVQYDQGKIANIFAHELGHAFGLLHTLDEDHLMYGDDENVQDNFDTLGLDIPTLQEENFVGRAPLENRYDSVNQQHEKLNSEYEQLFSEYETFLKEYDLTPEMVASSVNTGESSILTQTVEESVEKINVKVNAKNTIADQMNLLTDLLNCFPDVKN